MTVAATAATGTAFRLDAELFEVSKRYPGHLAVDRVSFSVGHGQFFSLLGPSGCGKTSTLRLIAGLETPSSGSIRIRGEDMKGRPAHRRPTNMVFQQLALFPHLDVAENVAFGLRLRRVSRAETRRPVHRLASGHPLQLHVHELEGGGPGPTLGLIATIHGDEPLSIETLRRLFDRLDPASFRGRIRAIPVANPLAFQSQTRNTPLDMSNLNRIFPGDPNGMASEQLAHVICETLLPGLDALIDLHSGGVWPTVEYVYIHDEGSELSRVFGLELLYRGSSYPGSLGNHARGLGIPTVVSELGGGQQHNDRFVERGLRGITNVMKQLGMLDGEPVLPANQEIMEEMVILRPHHGGILYSEVEVDRLGERVPRGTVLGRIMDPYSFEVLEVVEAPYEPSVMVLTRERFTKVDPGDYGFMVADGARLTPL